MYNSGMRILMDRDRIDGRNAYNTDIRVLKTKVNIRVIGIIDQILGW